MAISTLLLLGGGLWAGPKRNLTSRATRLIIAYVNIGVFSLLYLFRRFQEFAPVAEIERQMDMGGRSHGDRAGPREPRTQKTNPHRGEVDVIPEASGAFELRVSQATFREQ